MNGPKDSSKKRKGPAASKGSKNSGNNSAPFWGTSKNQNPKSMRIRKKKGILNEKDPKYREVFKPCILPFKYYDKKLNPITSYDCVDILPSIPDKLGKKCATEVDQDVFFTEWGYCIPRDQALKAKKRKIIVSDESPIELEPESPGAYSSNSNNNFSVEPFDPSEIRSFLQSINPDNVGIIFNLLKSRHSSQYIKQYKNQIYDEIAQYISFLNKITDLRKASDLAEPVAKSSSKKSKANSGSSSRLNSADSAEDEVNAAVNAARNARETYEILRGDASGSEDRLNDSQNFDVSGETMADVRLKETFKSPLPVFYPPVTDPKDTFYKTLLRKKEFIQNRILFGPEKKIEDLCTAQEFRLQEHQNFVKNYLSYETPYNGLLFFHGTGTGKCVHPDSRVNLSVPGFVHKSPQTIWNTIYNIPAIDDDSSVSRPPEIYMNQKDTLDGIKSYDSMRIEDIWYSCPSKEYPDPDVPNAEWKEWNHDLFYIPSYDSNANRIIPKRVLRVYRQYIDYYLVELHLKSGKKIKMTLSHKVFTQNGWADYGSLLSLYSSLEPHNVLFLNIIRDATNIDHSEISYLVRTPYKGYVYDLEIDDTHCYFVEDILTHNTCAAITVAETLKSYYPNKVLVILSQSIVENFMKELYNFDKEFVDGGLLQCTGTEYLISSDEIPNLDQRQKKIRNRIKQYYEFITYGELNGKMEKIAQSQGGTFSLNPRKDNYSEQVGLEAVREYFSNRLIIIDEVHNVRITGDLAKSENDKRIPQLIEHMIRNGQNNRLVLMSATPMYNSPNEIIYILNLLLQNDKREPVKERDIFKKNGKLTTEKTYQGMDGKTALAELCKGYISYIRGANPISFPRKVYPPKELLYIPKPRLDENKKPIGEDDQIKHNHVVRCKLSKYQYDSYLAAKKSSYEPDDEDDVMSPEEEDKDIGKSEDDDETFDIIGRNALNIVYPSGDEDEPGLVGKVGFNGCFKTSGRSKTYEYTENALVEDGIPFLSKRVLSDYSVKFDMILDQIMTTPGVAFIFSEFKGNGVLPMALCLEQNGYMPFASQKPLLNSPLKEEPLCFCGIEASNHNRSGIGHEFTPARYVYLDGDIPAKQRSDIVKQVNSPANRDGRLAKVILGTRVASEGVDFKRIRQIHILNPWYNLSRMDQTVGRGVRHCSHMDLPIDERYVKIYLYCASSPNGVMETTDEKIHRIAEKKDVLIKKVEKVLKQNAIDCFTNRQVNIFPKDQWGDLGDKEDSRECHYGECIIKCPYVTKNPEAKNFSTFSVTHMKTELKKYENAIQSIFNEFTIYSLPEIEAILASRIRSFDTNTLYYTLQHLLENHIIFNTSRGPGYVVYRNNYYVFQPLNQPLRLSWHSRAYGASNSDDGIAVRRNNIRRIIDSINPYTKEIKTPAKGSKSPAKSIAIEKMPASSSVASSSKNIRSPPKPSSSPKSAPKQEISNKDILRNVSEILPAILSAKSFGELGYHMDRLDNKPYVYLWYLHELDTSSDAKRIRPMLTKYFKDFLMSNDKMAQNTIRFNDHIFGKSWLVNTDTNLIYDEVSIPLYNEQAGPNVRDVYGYFAKNTAGQYLIKLIDMKKQKGVTTKKGDISKRSAIRGKFCGNGYDKEELVDIYKYLSGNESYDGNRSQLCKEIEILLRNKQHESNGEVDWFLRNIEA